MRLFACLRPPAAVLDHLEQALTAVSPPWAGAGPPPLRWVAPEQRHVTLAFYGEVPDGAVDELAAALGTVAATHPPVEVQLSGAGVFTGATLWIGVRATREDTLLPRLMGQCAGAGEGIARLELRERSRAHLTVARLSARGRREPRRSPGSRRPARDPRAGDRAELTALAHALTVYRGPQWQADGIELVRSQLGAGRGGGPQHEVVARLPFIGG